MVLATNTVVGEDVVYMAADQSLLTEVLRNITALRKLQSIALIRLDLDKLTVDLLQSLRGVSLLPSLTSLTLNICGAEMISFVSLACDAESLMDLLLFCRGGSFRTS
jgi:hypothetical protein